MKKIIFFSIALILSSFGWMDKGGIIGANLTFQAAGSEVLTNVVGSTTNITTNTWLNRAIVGTAGEVSYVRDTSNSYTIEFTGTLAIDPYAVGPGGLDKVSIASNTLYALYVIAQSKGRSRSNVTVIMSTNLVTPVLPTNANGTYLAWNTWRRVGAVRTMWTNGHATNAFVVPFSQIGNGNEREMVYNVQRTYLNVLASNAATNTTLTSLSLADYIPCDGVAILGFEALYISTNGELSVQFVTELGMQEATQIPTLTFNAGDDAVTAGTTMRGVLRIPIKDRRIYWRTGGTAGQQHLGLFVSSYVDNL